MFKPITLKIVTYICLVSSILLFVIAAYRAFDSSEVKYYLPLFSLLLLVLSSSWALNIVNNYEHAIKLKDVGWQIYFILLLLMLFGYANLTLGVLPVVFLTSSLYSKNRDVVISLKAEEKID